MPIALSRKKSSLVLIAFILVCLAAGGIGGIATAENVSGWYRTIEKPSWNPPGWLFGPVWTSLYLMMAIAAWLVWKDQNSLPPRKRTALILFGIQLALNSLWSFVFFEWHQLGWSLVEILVLWIAIVATLLSFFRIRKAAGWLLVPYLAWVSFASFLTYTIWTLNR